MKLNRKIEASELAMKINHGGIVSAGGLFGRVKNAQTDRFFVYINLCAKLFSFRKHATIPSCVIPLFALIPRVFNACAKPQITPPIIQWVAVNVVNLFFGRRVHYYPVHQKAGTFFIAFCASISPNAAGFIDSCAPLKFAQPFKIFVIHNSNIPLCQLYLFHNPKKEKRLAKRGIGY